MSSEDFRIIPHQVAEAVDPAMPDLYRYLICYASSAQPQYVAADSEGRLHLVNDEKLALRYLSIADAERGLAAARQNCALQLSGTNILN